MGSGSKERLTETLAVFERTEYPGEPLTTREVSDNLDCTRRAAYNRLEQLANSGALETKKVGARGRVWWRPSLDTATTSNGDARDNRELARYEAAIETIGDGVYIVDDESRFLMVNRAECELTGYDRSELLGAHGSLVTTEADLALAERRRDDLVELGDGVTTVETTLVTKDGQEIPVETQFALLPLGDDRYGRVGVVRDIRERKQRQREIETQVRQQEVITELGHLALESRDIDRLMQRVSTVVADTLGNDYCKVLELDASNEELLLRQGTGWDDGIVGHVSVSATEDDSQAAYTLQTAQPVVVEDLSEERRFSGPELLTSHEVLSGISTIIGPFDDPWGILGTHDCERKTFTDHDVNFVQSVAHILTAAINRQEYERQLEHYETIVETIDDGVYVLDEDYHFTKVNQAYSEMMGYSRSELLGAHCSLVVGEEISKQAADWSRSLVGNDDHAMLEAEIERADGSQFYAESRFTPLPKAESKANDDLFGGTVGVVRDTTRRRERERQLERRREQLVALNDLNDVIHGITDAVISQSTRAEVEQVVCDRFADTETTQFAWIGELERSLDSVRIKATSGCGEISGMDLSIDAERRTAYGEMVADALQTQTVQVRHNDAADEWMQGKTDTADVADQLFRTLLTESQVRSTVCIPIVHEGLIFGVLTVSTDRIGAFGDDERGAITHLGELIGHSFASIERKRALMSQEVVELQFRTPDFGEILGISSELEGTVTIEKTVEVSEEQYLAYGTVTDEGLDALKKLFEANSGWDELSLSESASGEQTFQISLSKAPVTSEVAEQGGEVVESRIVDGTIHLRFHLPPGTDVRAITDVVQTAYPGTKMTARRQVNRLEPDVEDTLTNELTDRQRASLEASFHAGFFEWPRASSGEDIAELLDISPSTFHQHLRTAERKVFDSLLS
ncbi:PAS domain S-box protein [Haloferax sp. DFSO60]|uniref:PAS domain S-box protein n=1 Tax=Haloferax sp. DFSO60 TaxID=3388652 RepID=UPI00397E3673